MHRVRLMAVAVATVLVTAFVCAVGAASPRVTFPSPRTTAVSPDGRFAIINLDSDKEPYHTLFLEDRSKHEKRKLLEYERSVEVLWNPDGSSFVLNDYMGSNISECYVYSTDPAKPRINIQEKILAMMKTLGETASVKQNHHVYWAAVRWLNSKTLRIKVWGYGEANPGGFTRFYNYRVR